MQIRQATILGGCVQLMLWKKRNVAVCVANRQFELSLMPMPEDKRWLAAVV